MTPRGVCSNDGLRSGCRAGVRVDTVRDSSDKPVSATAQRVAELLRERIVKGELPPGARLVERTLSADLEVSRTPVREALKLLQADGLIEISLHRGAQVTHYTAAEAAGLFDLLAVIEGLAAERLAERLAEQEDTQLLDGLEALHERMLALYRAGDAAAYFDVNNRIHDTVVARCGNPVLGESRDRLVIRARRGRYLSVMRQTRWAQAVDEHERLMTALRLGDPGAAATVWRQHLAETGRAVTTLLRDRGL